MWLRWSLRLRPVLSEGKAGPHTIQGIGAGFVPKVLNTGVYDEVVPVSGDDAFAFARMMGKTEGVLVGISSGAALAAAIRIAQRKENEGKTIVALLPTAATDIYRRRCTRSNVENKILRGNGYRRKIRKGETDDAQNLCG